MHPQIKTHDSESRGQEKVAIIRETKITWPLSELFTKKIAHKITNGRAKQHKHYHLVITDLHSTFLLYRINKPTIVEISAIVLKYVPADASLMALVLVPTPDKPSFSA